MSMYVLMAWGRVNAGAWEGLEEHYNRSVKTVTQAMKGFRERQLWRGMEDPQESVFYSVWDSLQELRDYETSPVRRDLAQRAEQYYHPLAYAQGETWIKHFEVVSVAKKADNEP